MHRRSGPEAGRQDRHAPRRDQRRRHRARLIVNGHFFASYGNIYNFIDANVTPFIKFGQKNEIIVIVGGKTMLQQVRLGSYDKGNYP